ncbi:MAG TPA: hypothetical protein VH020_09370 [Stellaceae bacterium]|jgi:hypothetical protein|nr:hypothetical protein [Stellaceae bacterium]
MSAMTKWGEKAVETVAQAIRRRQFERTRRLAAFDEAAPPTENELDNARAAIIATIECLSGCGSGNATSQFMLDAAKREIEEK